MISLVYVSSAVHLLTDAELLDILKASREHNAQNDITGLLLYKGGNFMQVLEGAEEKVIALYNKIQRDPRHKDIMMLIKEPLQERQFGEWSMGFQNIDKLPAEALAGFSSFLTEDFTSDAFRNNPKRAHIMLLSFKKNMR
jgi:hypothetical protein